MMRPIYLFLEPLISLDRGAELGPRERVEAPFVPLAESFRFLGECGQVARQRFAVAAGVEVRQIPFR